MPHLEDQPPLDPRRPSSTSNATTDSFQSARTHLSNDASSDDMAVSAPAAGSERVVMVGVEDQVTGVGAPHTNGVSTTDVSGDATTPFLNGSLTDRSNSTSPDDATDDNGDIDNNDQALGSAEDNTPRGRTSHRNTHTESPPQSRINGTHPDTPQGRLFRRNSDVQTTTRPIPSTVQLPIRAVRNEFNTPLPDTPEMEAGTGQNSQDFFQAEAPFPERQTLDGNLNVPSQLRNSNSAQAEADISSQRPADLQYYIVPLPLNDSYSRTGTAPSDAEPFRQFSENTFSTATRPPLEQPYYGHGALSGPARSSPRPASTDANLPDEDKENNCLRCPIHCSDYGATDSPHSSSQPRRNDDEERDKCLQCPNHCPDPDEMAASPSLQLPGNFDGADDSKPSTPRTGSSRRRPTPRRNLVTGSPSQPNRTEHPESQLPTAEQQEITVNADPIQHIPPFNPPGRAQTASSTLQSLLSAEDQMALENERRTAADRRRSGGLHPGLERGRTRLPPYALPPSSSSSDERGAPSVQYDFSPRARGSGGTLRRQESGLGVGTDRLRSDDRPAAQLNPAARTFDPRTQLGGFRATQTVEYLNQDNMASENGRGRGLGETLRITERELQQTFIQFDEAARRDDPFGGPLIRPSPSYQPVGPQQTGQQPSGYRSSECKSYGQQLSGYRPSSNQTQHYRYQTYAPQNAGSQTLRYQPSGPAPTRRKPATQQPPNSGGQISAPGFGNTTQTTDTRYRFATQPSGYLAPIPTTPEQRYSAPQYTAQQPSRQQAPLYHPPFAHHPPPPQPPVHQPTYHQPTDYEPNPLGPTAPYYGGNTQRLPPPVPQGSLTSPNSHYNPRLYPWQVMAAGQGRGRGVGVGEGTASANLNASSALEHPAPRIVSTGLSGDDSEESVESEEE